MRSFHDFIIIWWYFSNVDFQTAFLNPFIGFWAENGAERAPWIRPKSYKKCYYWASFWGSWHVLASIWYPFGALWVTLGYFFGAISWHLRLALAWFGIILRPFLFKLVWPESGHEFTRGFRQSLVVFHRASWYFIKLLGNLILRKSSWVFHNRFRHIA